MFLKLHLNLIKNGLLNYVDRTPFISQAQSVNLFLPADVHKKDQIKFILMLKKGLKVLLL